MTQWHMKSNKLASGGINYAKNRCDKKLAWKGGDFAATTIAQEPETLVVQARGLVVKHKARKAREAAVTDQKTGKTVKGVIVTVSGNEANRHFARQNIMTKGAIISVKLGDKTVKARVTSRPGQVGVVQAVLAPEAEKAAEAAAATKQAKASASKAKKAKKAEKA
ncbi:MAG TPA: 30S ribosomal protein S8e [Candidatus Diapherotrites archaeon]|uniref:30S ribosomal protein S8e n=1 Tax=Candidatus Iainarchaeum sp. TaxID=3101447 RepID=A0A7J4JHY8_9ARCH|nr:30S ribosomal protein S8e [Candidatus Diapherotrites archaeon]HIH16934.1 30S ribosomal protein S8e [Candidatus Diapherotrites archaeon]